FADPFNDDHLVPLSTTPTTPTITLAVNPSIVTEDGTTNLVYTLTRTGDLANSLIVNVNGGGTAVLGTDFSISGPIGQSTSGSIASVTFAAGSSTATVIVDPIPNSIPGGNKTVFATLAPGVGYNIGTVGAVTGTILEDDVVAPTLAIAPTNATQIEGNSGTKAFTFTVTRNGDPTSSSSANWSVTGSGTNPANGADFVGGTLPTGTVNFTAGETSKSITVNVLGDTTVEPDEGFTVTLSNPTNANITTGTATGTITNDDRTLTPIIDYAPNVNISTGLVFSTNGGGNLSLDTNRLSMSNEVTGVQNGTKSNFNHLFGLYEVVDADGGINTGSGIVKPGDRDYAFHALTTARVKDFIVQAGNSDIPSTATQLGSGVSLQGNKFYAPFVIANCGTYFPNLQQGVEDFIAAENGDVNRFANAPKHVRDLVATEVDNEFNNAPRFVQEPVAYFSFGSANPDKSPHLRSYGNGVYGFEDLPATATQYSNNDFNDAVFALS
ncbi:DUF4114 domain-containing protein, partial [Cylindrospermopsis raciborskii CHAB3438]|uniref:Calx-beta domain-containing protein n=2 Tax=Cylindrospermopsis raciborskii TaxID=77022 RepID=UPI0023F091DA